MLVLDRWKTVLGFQDTGTCYLLFVIPYVLFKHAVSFLTFRSRNFTFKF